jgi:hypothetical protein
MAGRWLMVGDAVGFLRPPANNPCHGSSRHGFMPSLRHLFGFTSAAFLLHYAQGQCATLPPASPLHPHGLGHPMERGGGAPFLIPTVVHIHYGGGVQPLGILHVQPLLDQCNADLRGLNPDIVDVVPAFAGLVGDMGMELRLATIDEDGNCMSGIRYHEYDPWVEQPNSLEPTQDTRHYLNIHIMPAMNSFATLPGPASNPYDPTDVIVLSAVQANLLSRTLAHEMGHWAGLMHVWGPAPTTGACGDDGIADTPITTGSQLDCILDRDQCTSGIIENVQNHMDYSNCRIMFTQGQAEYATAVLTDTTIVRASVVTAENLVNTGVTTPASCSISAGIYHRPSISCTGTTLSYRAMAEYGLADSVRWVFQGGSPAISDDDQPEVLYAATGDYAVQLQVYGAGTNATTSEVVHVDVPDPNSNGLSVISSFPFTEGFENGFTLPQPNMFAVESSTPTWEPFTQAGYASDNSLYVSAESVDFADTNDLVIGNFDFSSLAQPALRFKVATSNYTFSGGCAVSVLFHDLCSNIFIGDQWYITQSYEFATDQGMNYVPSADGQWSTITVTFPEWNMATSAELVLRVVRPWLPDSYTPEALYIDDLYVGELPISTVVPETASVDGLILAPNPAHDRVQVRLPSTTSTALLHVTDVMGRLVEQRRIAGGTLDLDVSAWPAGAYLVTVESANGGAQYKLMVE